MRRPSYLLFFALLFTPRQAPAQTLGTLHKSTWVHVDASPSTRLLGRPDADSEWTFVCHAPCDAHMPLGWAYQLEGAGMRSSPPFFLQASADGRTFLRLHPASEAWFVGGIAAQATGAAGVLIGLPAVLVSGIRCGLTPGGPCNQETLTELEGVGVVSAALIVFGVIAVVANGSTTVSQDGGKEAPAPPEPVWQERRFLRSSAPTPGAPLFVLRF
jgi:hypothetical protein